MTRNCLVCINDNNCVKDKLMHFIVKKLVDYFIETCAFFRTGENGFNIHISSGVGF